LVLRRGDISTLSTHMCVYAYVCAYLYVCVHVHAHAHVHVHVFSYYSADEGHHKSC